MIGNGEIWITGFCMDKSCKPSDIKIGTIQATKNLQEKTPHHRPNNCCVSIHSSRSALRKIIST